MRLKSRKAKPVSREGISNISKRGKPAIVSEFGKEVRGKSSYAWVRGLLPQGEKRNRVKKKGV